MLDIASPLYTISRDPKDLSGCPIVIRQDVSRPLEVKKELVLTPCNRFEKDLYDLIRGLRNHKGNEKAYIQDSIRECRKEVKGSDMDLKATALLKLTYLEMFGHDMSWASFNVLEVMSSPKHAHKKVGYLAAVQSFRPDTEVLMLAENLLKKDLMSPQPPNISLPLVAIPHVISSSMANSLLADILPRLTHSNPAIRKKTVATLYRLALAYPDTLRPAWPRIKERLMDDNEDPSVISAVINVICELGWRRPQDFLPLAPRLFDLLVDGNNNWMAIKIIKLFAALTPLEPRLVKKLLPPLTTLIKTTPAMSLLYECINGIIQGGIFESASGTTEGDEIARLCVTKLRSMLGVTGDPNLKFVALLAFNKIVESHPYLVSEHEDTIMECIDDPDISIRLRALDLVVGMVNASNLISLVDRLMRQLTTSPLASSADNALNDRSLYAGVEPEADDDDLDAAETIDTQESRSQKTPPLPEEYRSSAIQRILEMCSRSTYSNISDFDWYIDTLTSLVRCIPAATVTTAQMMKAEARTSELHADLAHEVGAELRNVAVRVKSSRREATQAAEVLITAGIDSNIFPASGTAGHGVLGPAAWVVGEFADMLANPHATLDSLLLAENSHLPADILSVYVQAAIKIFARISGGELQSWTQERKTMITLLLARMVHWLEPLTSHPSLEIQERAVEFLELARLTTEAVNSHAMSEDGAYTQPPLLLTQAIPSLFAGMELNPVARDAQRKVPVPDNVDLDTPINENLQQLLNVQEMIDAGDEDEDFRQYYYTRPKKASYGSESAISVPAVSLLPSVEQEVVSYQQSAAVLDPTEAARRRAERRERQKDDPFYMPSEDNSGTATPIHNILKTQNGEEFDVDSIPVMPLDLEAPAVSSAEAQSRQQAAVARKEAKEKLPRRQFEILAEEDISGSDTGSARSGKSATRTSARSLLQVDSSGLGALSLSDSSVSGTKRGARNTQAQQLEIERRAAEEAEMAAAMREVERLRLEMQRAQERIEVRQNAASGASGETVLQRKAKKTKKRREAVIEGDDMGMSAPAEEEMLPSADGGTTKVRKKKKKKTKEGDARLEAEVQQGEEAAHAPKPKKKKKRRQIESEEDAAAAE